MQKEYTVKITEENDKTVFSVETASSSKMAFKCYLHDELLNDMPQIHIETANAIYDGPIEYLLKN